MEIKTNKVLGVFFAFVLLLGMASATLTISNIPELGHTSGSFNVTISSTENETVSIEIDSIDQGANSANSITFSHPTSIDLNEGNGRSGEIMVTYSVPSGFVFELGKIYETSLDLNGSVSGTKSESITFKESDFCEGVPNEGNLDIRDLEFDVEIGYGDSDEFWYLLDTISVDVEVENDGSWDVRDVQVEWELYTTNGDLIMDGDTNQIDIDENDDGTFTITFKLEEDLSDFEGEDAVLYVRATGEIDDSKSNFDGDDTCDFASREVEVRTGDRFVIAEDLTLNGEVVERNDFLDGEISCGSTVELQGSVFNIGDRDEDDVYLMVYSEEFGILEKIEFNEVKAFKSEEFSYTFNLPKDTKEGNYKLELSVYDEDNDLYENEENDESVTNVYFVVEGNCVASAPTITAEIDSGEAKAGSEVTIKATLRNEDTKEQTFILSAEGYSEWASLLKLEPQTFTLEPGESKEVLITLKLDRDSEGEKAFNIVASSNGQVVISKPVLLNVEKSGSLFQNLNWNTDNWNWQLIGIIALNVILLVAIIIVAAKVLKRR